MTTILDIPEVIAVDSRRGVVRIPPEVDVPLTPRVRQLIDTADFRRLARISQLGLVSVYPAAIHAIGTSWRKPFGLASEVVTPTSVFRGPSARRRRSFCRLLTIQDGRSAT